MKVDKNKEVILRGERFRERCKIGDCEIVIKGHYTHSYNGHIIKGLRSVGLIGSIATVPVCLYKTPKDLYFVVYQPRYNSREQEIEQLDWSAAAELRMLLTPRGHGEEG